MIENKDYFRFAKKGDIEEITSLVRKHDKWFSHLCFRTLYDKK